MRQRKSESTTDQKKRLKSTLEQKFIEVVGICRMSLFFVLFCSYVMWFLSHFVSLYDISRSISQSEHRSQFQTNTDITHSLDAFWGQIRYLNNSMISFCTCLWYFSLFIHISVYKSINWYMLLLCDFIIASSLCFIY